MDLKLLENCTLCPRNCKADRLSGKVGVCGVSGDKIKIARAALHMWEEPCISGENGSGTVFFSGCNLKCVYCQNRAISRDLTGSDVTTGKLADIFLDLQKQGAHNINLVTPTHYIPQIISALDIAKSRGMKLPVIYNCGGYEKPETIEMLRGYVDVYLPDFKYINDETAVKYSSAKDYTEYAKEAIDAMVNQAGDITFDDDGMVKKGVIVRHLVLPGCYEDSKRIIKYLYDKYKNRIYMSIMSQYTPVNKTEFAELSSPIDMQKYDEVIDYAADIGVENAFIQDGESISESFIPDFFSQDF